MARIYKIKRPPKVILEYFENTFPLKEGHTFEFYHYKSSQGIDGKKIYGCFVSQNGQVIHYSTQASLDWFLSQTK